jgi:hypothetical protein
MAAAAVVLFIVPQAVLVAVAAVHHISQICIQVLPIYKAGVQPPHRIPQINVVLTASLR